MDNPVRHCAFICAISLIASVAYAGDPPLRSIMLGYTQVYEVDSYWGGMEYTTRADSVWRPSPTGALRRSLILPGWGQIYNKQYIKAPIVVGVLGGLIGATIHGHNRARLFRHAAIYDDCLNENANVPPDACTDFERYESAFYRADALTAGPLNAQSARILRDQFRRQRDLMGLITILVYGLQALDAYVAAELADFDLGEDLYLQLAPDPHGAQVRLRWQF